MLRKHPMLLKTFAIIKVLSEYIVFKKLPSATSKLDAKFLTNISQNRCTAIDKKSQLFWNTAPLLFYLSSSPIVHLIIQISYLQRQKVAMFNYLVKLVNCSYSELRWFLKWMHSTSSFKQISTCNVMNTYKTSLVQK